MNDVVNLPACADAVVVGGGIVGCSVFYHLLKAGMKNVVLLERYKIASGTTFHSAALVPPLAPTRSETVLAKYSIDLYSSLEAETGQSTGWHKCGHLNLAASKDRHDALKVFLSSLHSRGVEGGFIGPDEVKRRWPLLNVEDIEAAIWMPGAGRVDSTNVCQALLKGGRKRGGKFFEDVPATDWIIRDRRVRGVRTPSGDIETSVVVNCTGLWGRKTSLKAGVSAPLFACEHFYLLTDGIEGIHRDLPALRDADAHLYMREDVGGILVGCFEPNPRPLPLENLPDAPFTLLNENWDHFEPILESAIKRIPTLSSAGARQLVNGPESFTMDHSPLLGESSEVEGFFLACGMNSFGVAMAGGVGWVVADWIVKGSPEIDVSNIDVRRFPRSQNGIRALSSRIPDVLAHHHAMPWPGYNYDSVRNVSRSAFFAIEKEYGAYFSERGGWERPIWYAGKGRTPTWRGTFGRPDWFNHWEREHLAARNAVAIFDGSPLSKILIQGRDAPAFINRVFSQDMGMSSGTARYTLMLNDQGGIESDPIVSRLDETVYLMTTGSAQARRDVDWLRRKIHADEAVVITDVSAGYSTVMVAGPSSDELLQRLSSDDLGDSAFPPNGVREIEIGYTSALAIKFSYTGERGYEIHVAPHLACSVLEALLEEGKALGVTLGGGAALNSLRIEKGYRSWGHDIGPKDTAVQSGLGFAVSKTKDVDFIGRGATTRELEGRGNRKLVSFEFKDSMAFPHGDEAIYRGEALCGYLSSASFGHSLGASVALGWVEDGPVENNAILGDEFEVDVAGVRHGVIPHLDAIYKGGFK